MGIYGMGKAFNLRYANSGQFRPRQVSFGRPQPMVFGGHTSINTNTNITIKNGPTGFWGFMSGLFGGLFGGGMMGGLFGGGGMGMGMGMGGFSPFGMLNTQMQPQITQQPKAGDRLADLQKLYPEWNIVSDGNGNYDATSKDGTVHEKGNFDEMCEKLKKKPTTEGLSTPEVSTPEVSTPTSNRPDRYRRKGGADDIAGTQGTQGEWTAAQKAKPYRLTMTADTNSSFGKCTATVVTPDGKTFKVQAATGGTSANRMDRLSTAMQEALKAAGWTNITLENKNYKWSSDGTEATGNVDKPNNGKQWSAEQKASYNKPLTIAFAVHSGGGVGNSGSATVTTPDGQVHQVTTGMSWTAARARKDLAKQMIELLHQRGWTNAQLQNNNFNDWQ